MLKDNKANYGKDTVALVGRKHNVVPDTAGYKIRISPYNNGLVVSVGNLYIGSVFDSPLFQASIDKFGHWLSEPQLEIGLALEDIVRETRKHLGPRFYTGLDPHSHIRRDFDVYLENSINADVKPDALGAFSHLSHDLVEDDKTILELVKEWELAVVNYDEQGRITIEENLRKERPAKLIETQLKLYEIVEDMTIPNSEKVELRKIISDSLRITDHLTRYPEKLPYPLSMAFQFDRRTNERLVLSLTRANTKLDDRIANNRDISPLPEMAGLISAQGDSTVFNGYRIDEYLRERYGELGIGGDMPPSVKIGNAVNTLSALPFLNKMLNEVTGHIQPGTREDELSRLVKYSKTRTIESGLDLVNSAIGFYEKLISQREIREVTDRIEQRRHSDYHNAVTPDGFFMRWLGFDIAGRRYIELLNESREMVDLYEIGGDLMESLPKFNFFSKKGDRDRYNRPRLITTNVIFDPNEHEYFTLDGMDTMLKGVQEGQNYLNLARRWLYEKHRLERNGNGK